MSMDIIFSPFVGLWILLALGVFACSLLLTAWFFNARAAFLWRAVFLLMIGLVLSGVMLRQEQKTYLPDKVIVAIDRSQSQDLAGRAQKTKEMSEDLRQKLSSFGNLEVEWIDVAKDSGATGTTEVFKDLDNVLLGHDANRIAATFLITDGQVHDVPKVLDRYQRFAPLHVLLSGDQDEFDRKIDILSAPQFSVVGQEAQISLRLNVESSRSEDQNAVLSIGVRQNGIEQAPVFLTSGETQDLTFKIDLAGQNVFEFYLNTDARDLSAVNDRAAVIVNGVRDRLKVLLVSGAPHMGERAWRNLLKSDPSIDLVHFTILRSPLSYDPATPNELSLIAFPADELFLRKIDEFDLIIFDRFSKYNLIDQSYVESIKSYVEKGGGFLFVLATGSWSDEDDRGLGPLAPVLPISLSQEKERKQEFIPSLTTEGQIHPVTQGLVAWQEKRTWGAWYAERVARARRGDVLMTGASQNPLLVLDTVGKGRVAALTSDHFWIWSRSGQQAGPYIDLMRNVAHWLMKEPELEKGFLKAEARGMNIVIAKRDDRDQNVTFMLTSPDNTKVDLKATKDKGWWTAQYAVKLQGVYEVAHDAQKVFVAVGDHAAAKEWQDVVTTDKKLSPVTAELGGGIFWFGKDVQLREIAPGATRLSGDNWAGLTRNRAFEQERIDTIRLLSWPIAFMLLMCMLLVCWAAESRKRH